MPTLKHGDWERFGKKYWNHHKRVFGVKLEIVAVTQRRPIPLHLKGGVNDLRIAREGVLAKLHDGERGLGDPGYIGAPERIYAPPRQNMKSYVPELDKMELSLQHQVEMLNHHLKEFKVLGTTYCKGAVRAYEDLKLIASVVAKLVYLDMLFVQEYSGEVHTSGPKPNTIVLQRVPRIAGVCAWYRLAQHFVKRKRDRDSGGPKEKPLLRSVKRR
jgi:hypothetical protein